MLLSTKLFVPQPHGTNVARPRLLAKLNAGLASRLLLVSAPAGFGKTTLATEWIHALHADDVGKDSQGGENVAKYAVGWLALAEDDNAAPRFFTYLLAALQRIDPTIGRDAEPMLASSQPPPADLLMTLLINDMAQLNQPFVLVLDDYHLITDQAIHHAVGFLVEKMPPLMKLVLTTRVDPPLPLARWRARRWLTEIRAQDLRFTEAESTLFLHNGLDVTLSPSEIAALERRTEGWVAGLQLVLLSMQGRTDPAAFIRNFTGSHAYIIDYLVEEVLQQQPPALEAFLLATAILERFCASLCNAVTAADDADERITQLARSNLFLFPLDQERQWYRYHHLFADVLQHRLRSQDPALAVTYHRRASHWYAERALANEAVHHAFAAGDLSLAADLIERFYDEVAKRGGQSFFAEWMGNLPAELCLARPILALGCANIHLIRYQLAEAEQWLEQLAPLLDQAGVDRQLRGEYLYQRAHAASRRFDFAGVIAYGERGRQLIAPEDVALHAKFQLLLGLAYYYVRGMAASLHAFAQATHFALQAGDLYIALYGINNQAEALVKLGRLHEAIAAFQSGLTLVAERPYEYLTITNRLHDGLSLVYYEINDLAAMQRHVDQALARHEWLNPVRNFENQVALAKLQFAQGDPALALTTIENALTAFTKQQLPPESSTYALQLRVYLWLALGEHGAARAWLTQSGLTVDDELNNARQAEYIALARILLATGDPATAYTLLQRLLAAAQADEQEGTQVELLALQALALAQRATPANAHAALADALTRGMNGGYVRTFVTLGPPLRQLLVDHLPGYEDLYPTALRRTMHQYVAQLLHAFPIPRSTAIAPAMPTASTPRSAQPLVEPLSDRELEVLRLVADGLSNSQIAGQLIITVGTVKRHLNNIFGKLGVSSRTQAIARARELELLP
jgi:LuxR family maltose regulon positive regulatory protein